MPELPEVETLRRGLDREFAGRVVVSAQVSRPKLLRDQDEATFQSRVVGKRLESPVRRGKYLLMPLTADPSNPPVTLCIHLNMRGALRLVDSASVSAADEQLLKDAHLAATLTVEGGRELRFYDSWGWGEIRALTAAELKESTSLDRMGLEPLSEAWTADTLTGALAGRRVAIKPSLLEQSVVAGVGNIYADEALWRAGIDPRRLAGSVTIEEAQRLVSCVKATLTEAIECGGSFGEYTNLYGQSGRYVPAAYDRGGATCNRCGETLSRIRLAGRGTTFCPRCQR